MMSARTPKTYLTPNPFLSHHIDLPSLDNLSGFSHTIFIHILKRLKEVDFSSIACMKNQSIGRSQRKKVTEMRRHSPGRDANIVSVVEIL